MKNNSMLNVLILKFLKERKTRDYVSVPLLAAKFKTNQSQVAKVVEALAANKIVKIDRSSSGTLYVKVSHES